MSNSPLFKRAFVRGLNAELIRQGVVLYPSKEAADATADYIADESGMPDPYSQGQNLDIKVASVLVDYLIKGADIQCSRAGNKYSPQLSKTAAAADPASWAQQDALNLMEKAAAESEENTLENAAKNNEEAANEQADRPSEYAHTGQGNQEQPSGGREGKEGEPTAPGKDGSKKVEGSNSAIEQKNASLHDIVRRVAQSKTAETSDHGPNDMPHAARNSDVLDDEMRERPENYANFDGDQGRTVFNIPADAQTGKEVIRADAEDVPYGASTNSVTEMVGGKTAFEHLFEGAAQELIPHLPDDLEDSHKVAHIRHMMGLETNERANYLGRLWTARGTKTAEVQARQSHYMKVASKVNEPEKQKSFPAGNNGNMPPSGQVGRQVQEKRPQPAKKTAQAQGSQTLSALGARLRNLHA